MTYCLPLALGHEPSILTQKRTRLDLFKFLFMQLDSKDLRFKLFWVPGHLDKSVSKVKHNVPDSHFLLNYSADFFAERAARAVELGMHHVSGVRYFSRMIQKVQKRFVRILISLIDKTRYDKKSVAFWLKCRSVAP